MDALVGAIVGGVLAIVGGVLAAWYTTKREKDAKEADAFEDYVAAVRVVRWELASNTATLDTYLQFGGQLVHDLDDSQFRAVQLALARRLPDKLRVLVVHAYHMIPFATGNIQFIASNASSNATQAQQVIQGVRDDLASAGNALATYMSHDLKVAVA